MCKICETCYWALHGDGSGQSICIETLPSKLIKEKGKETKDYYHCEGKLYK